MQICSLRVTYASMQPESLTYAGMQSEGLASECRQPEGLPYAMYTAWGVSPMQVCSRSVSPGSSLVLSGQALGREQKGWP
jgi:hypothetical protein